MASVYGQRWQFIFDDLRGRVYVLPWLVNQTGSVAYLAAVQRAPLSLAVPTANSLAFAFTAVVGAAVGAEEPLDKGEELEALHIHLAANDYTHVDRLLKDAIMDFPNVTSHILEAAKHDASASIQSHEIFQTNVKRPHYVLYAKLACGKWREPPVMEWFLRNINELIQQYENDASFKKTFEVENDFKRNYYERNVSIENIYPSLKAGIAFVILLVLQVSMGDGDHLPSGYKPPLSTPKQAKPPDSG
ncbi:hypothetical protein evm_014548 [Chilo suppressalis]|nr:hypothetical protein evm_014548 [Chilo suppressalis]